LKRIIFCTKSVSIAGGREKILTDLANHLSDHNFNVEILVYDNSLIPAFPLNNNIRVQAVTLKSANPASSYLHKINDFFDDVKALRSYGKIFNDSDRIIATDYLFSVFIFFSNRKLAKKLIAWEHSSYTLWPSFAWSKVRNYVYPRLKLIVALNEAEQFFFERLGCKATTIPNMVMQQKPSDLTNKNAAVWVGAFITRKGVAELIELAKMIKQERGPSINVFGDGELKDVLKAAIKEHELERILILKGVESTIEHIYKDAILLIMTSNNECLPMVILEAFSFGIPVVSFDCDTGPRYIIHHRQDGYLIKQGDVRSMHETIKSIMDDKYSLCEMGRSAFMSSKKYYPEAVYPMWGSVLA